MKSIGEAGPSSRCKRKSFTTAPKPVFVPHECRSHLGFSLGGTSRGNLDDVHKQWSQQIVRDNMRNSSPQFPPLDGVGQLSVAVVIQAAESIIDSFDGVTHEDDVFYLVYSRTISRRAAGIRNILQVAEGPETTEQEINGVLYHQKRPFTYWLPIPVTVHV